MSIFQLLAVLFGLCMVYVVNIHKKKAHFNKIEYIFWIIIWIMFIVISIFPNILAGISGALHFSRVFDLLLVAALMILTAVVFSNYMTHKENTKKLEDLVRKIAIDKKNEK